ncbi:MAG: PKD domain-containing protein [Methanophagales archaeon]|nr:PKD domain-containing protein [Methanophagales archaeon]
MPGTVKFDEDPYIYYGGKRYNLGSTITVTAGETFWLHAKVRCTYTKVSQISVTVRLLIDSTEVCRRFDTVPCKDQTKKLPAIGCTPSKSGTAKVELWLGDPDRQGELKETKYSWTIEIGKPLPEYKFNYAYIWYNGHVYKPGSTLRAPAGATLTARAWVRNTNNVSGTACYGVVWGNYYRCGPKTKDIDAGKSWVRMPDCTFSMPSSDKDAVLHCGSYEGGTCYTHDTTDAIHLRVQLPKAYTELTCIDPHKTATVGDTVDLEVLLTDAISPKRPLDGRWIEFYKLVDSTEVSIGSCATNPEGKCSITYTCSVEETATIKAKFKGDADYKESECTFTITVTTPPPKLEIKEVYYSTDNGITFWGVTEGGTIDLGDCKRPLFKIIIKNMGGASDKRCLWLREGKGCSTENTIGIETSSITLGTDESEQFLLDCNVDMDYGKDYSFHIKDGQIIQGCPSDDEFDFETQAQSPYEIRTTVKDEEGNGIEHAYVSVTKEIFEGTWQEVPCSDITVHKGVCTTESWKGYGNLLKTDDEGVLSIGLPSLPGAACRYGFIAGKPGYLNSDMHEDWTEVKTTRRQGGNGEGEGTYEFEFTLRPITEEDKFIVHTKGFKEGDTVLCRRAYAWSRCFIPAPGTDIHEKKPDKYPDGEVVFTKDDGLVEGETYGIGPNIAKGFLPTGPVWCGKFEGTKDIYLYSRYGVFGEACELMGIPKDSDECRRFWAEMLDPIYCADVISGVIRGKDIYGAEYHPDAFELAMFPIVVVCSVLPMVPGGKITKYLGKIIRKGVKHGDDVAAVREFIEANPTEAYRILVYGDEAKLDLWAKAIADGDIERAKELGEAILRNPAIEDWEAINKFNRWLDELEKQIKNIDPKQAKEIADLEKAIKDTARSVLAEIGYADIRYGNAKRLANVLYNNWDGAFELAKRAEAYGTFFDAYQKVKYGKDIAGNIAEPTVDEYGLIITAFNRAHRVGDFSETGLMFSEIAAYADEEIKQIVRDAFSEEKFWYFWRVASDDLKDEYISYLRNGDLDVAAGMLDDVWNIGTVTARNVEDFAEEIDDALAYFDLERLEAMYEGTGAYSAYRNALERLHDWPDAYARLLDEAYPAYIYTLRYGDRTKNITVFIKAADAVCSPGHWCKLNQIVGLAEDGKLIIDGETLDLFEFTKALYDAGFTLDTTKKGYKKTFMAIAAMKPEDVKQINELLAAGKNKEVLGYFEYLAGLPADKKTFEVLLKHRNSLLGFWKELTNKSAAGSGFGHDFWRSIWAGIKNRMPWRKAPKDISDVLTTDELKKLLDAGTIDKIARKLDKEGRYADPSELFRYVILKDPEFFKKGYSNALMKKFEHFDDPDEIAKHIKPLTPEEATERRNWFKNLREEFKKVLGDKRGEEVFNALGLDSIEETAELNRLFWLYGKAMYDDIYERAIATGASEEIANELAKTALSAQIDIARGFATGAIKTGKQLEKGLLAKIKKHPILAGALGFAAFCGTWYILDNLVMNVYVGRKAGVIEKTFGEQFAIVEDKLKTLGFQIRDNPCDPTVQRDYIAMLEELERLKNIADAVDPTKRNEAINLYATLYGVSIGEPNEFMRNQVRTAWSVYRNEYTFAVRSAGCIAPLEPPGGWPPDVYVPELNEVITATVLKHKDADTIHIRHAGTPYCVRIVGINSPEGPDYVYICTKKKEPWLVRRLVTPGEECISEELWYVDSVFYARANAWLANMLPVGTNITLKSDSERQWDLKHKTPRLIAAVFKGTTNIGIEELKEGYAVLFVYDKNKHVWDATNNKIKDEYVNAENSARLKKTRIWDPKWRKPCPATGAWFNYYSGARESVRVGVEATFEGHAKGCDDSEITDWEWVFPHDVKKTGRVVTHTFTEAGSYEVHLKICAGTIDVHRTITVSKAYEYRKSPCGNYGNVNNDPDNYVTDEDAKLVMDYVELGWGAVKDKVGGLSESEFKERADVDDDGEVTSNDADMIYAYYAGSDTGRDTFPVCPGAPPAVKNVRIIAPNTVNVGESATLIGMASTEDPYKVTSWTWTISDPDGIETEKTGKTITHTFDKVGVWGIRLEACNNATPPNCGTATHKITAKVVTTPPPEGKLTIMTFESIVFKKPCDVETFLIDGVDKGGGSAVTATVPAGPHTVEVVGKEGEFNHCYVDILDRCFSPSCAFSVDVKANETTVVKVCKAAYIYLSAYSGTDGSYISATFYYKPYDIAGATYKEIATGELIPYGRHYIKAVASGHETLEMVISVSDSGISCEAAISTGASCYGTEPSMPAHGLYCRNFIVKAYLKKGAVTKTVTFESEPKGASITVLD